MQYQQTQILVLEEKELTNRKCEVCNKPVYKKYKVETVRKTGEVLSKIVSWADRYTCSKSCADVRNNIIRTNTGMDDNIITTPIRYVHR